MQANVSEAAVVEIDKVRGITLIGAEQKELVLKSVPLLAIPYMPITKDFIQDYILNDVEYPTMEGKISQAATEMRVRLNALVDHNYQFQMCELEKQELELDIEEIKKNKKLSKPRRAIQVSKKQLELQMKAYRAHSIRQTAESTFTEFVHWMNTVEDGVAYMMKNHPEIKSFSDIDFNKVRCLEMEMKITQWEQAATSGKQLTTPQQVFVAAKQRKKAT